MQFTTPAPTSIPSAGIVACACCYDLIETDFPHPTCLYPGPRKKLEEAVASLSEADQRKLFFGNAARVYGVESTA